MFIRTNLVKRNYFFQSGNLGNGTTQVSVAEIQPTPTSFDRTTSVTASNPASSNCAPSDSNQLQFSAFAAQFAEWFYKMLNSCSPFTETPSDFGPIHFFSDCSLHLKSVSGEQCDELQCSGSDAVCNKLRSFVRDDKVLFNPHLDVGGCASRTNSFGMSEIRVAGTLHREEQLLGLFVQQFGVLKDPAMQFNWRIKSTHLCVKAGQALSPPSITGTLAALLPPHS